MNKDKQYYLDLAERWFDAETSEAEEKELRRFLAATEDPDFDEARAALGFLAASSLRAGLLGTSATTASGSSKRRWLIPAVAVAASLVLAFFFGRMTAPVEVVPVGAGTCVSYVHGVEVNDEDFAVATMESTLSDFFSPSSAPDPRTDLSLIFNANE
ncbi:MAG: hypothetical protein IKR96_00490 [Bacteroidales bacterium]|nr:hypothetical protein [Bacteroidales bacterium]